MIAKVETSPTVLLVFIGTFSSQSGAPPPGGQSRIVMRGLRQDAPFPIARQGGFRAAIPSAGR
jgi:hypothetical protein